MARMRSLKPEYYTDEELATQTSRDARLLYPGLWGLADEHSRLRGDARYLKGQLFMYDDDLTPDAVDKLIDELEALGKVVRYRSGNASYLFLPTLARHQRLDTDKVPSRLPPPPLTDVSGKFPDDPGNGPNSYGSDRENPGYADTGITTSGNTPSGKIPDKSGTRPESPEDVQARARASFKHVAGSREQVAGAKNPAAAAITVVQKHTDATPAEAEAVALIVKSTRNPRRLPGLLDTMGAAGDLDSILGDVRIAASRLQVAAAVRDAKEDPPCVHGQTGGASIHPGTGLPFCPLCRAAVVRASVA